MVVGALAASREIYRIGMGRAAERAVQGDYFITGQALAERRRKDVRMNTEVRDVREEPGL